MEYDLNDVGINRDMNNSRLFTIGLAVSYVIICLLFQYNK